MITIDKTVIKIVINPTLEIIYYFKYCYSFIIHVGHIVARVRLNRINTDGYAHCFRSIFETVKKDYPSFNIGDSLQGIVLDWSDQQMKGLETVVGITVAAKVAKECRVHFLRSVKRVSEQVNKNNAQSYRAFMTIVYEIPNQNNEKDVLIYWKERTLKLHYLCVNLVLFSQSTVRNTTKNYGSHSLIGYHGGSVIGTYVSNKAYINQLIYSTDRNAC